MRSAPHLAARVAAVKDERAERVVLCGVLREAELVLPRLAEAGFSHEAFAVWAHSRVYLAALGLYEAGRDVDAAAVYLRLRVAGELPELGWRPGLWLAELLDEDPTGAWALPGAARVLELWGRRTRAHRALVEYRDAVGLGRAV